MPCPHRTVVVDLDVLALIDPFADHPFELLEPLVGRDAGGRRGVVADLGDLPGIALPREQGDEPVGDRGLLGRDQPGDPLGLRHVGRDQADALGLPVERVGRRLGEGVGELLGDRLPAAGGDVVGIDERAVLREELDDPGRILLVVRVDVGDERLPHGLLDGRRRVGGRGGRSGPGRLHLSGYSEPTFGALPEAGWSERTKERHSDREMLQGPNHGDKSWLRPG